MVLEKDARKYEQKEHLDLPTEGCRQRKYIGHITRQGGLDTGHVERQASHDVHSDLVSKDGE